MLVVIKHNKGIKYLRMQVNECLKCENLYFD